MKKIIVLLLSAALVCSLAACADAGNNIPDSSDAALTETEPETAAKTEEETTEAEETTAPEEPEETAAPEEETASPDEEGDAPQEGSESDSTALTILNTVWDSYGEDEKFAAFGGDTSEEHLTEGAPGVYSLAEPEVMDSSLGFPADCTDRIDDAASLVNMLNVNTFTCGAYHVIHQEEMDSTITAVRDNILARQWMCGFPEKLVIVTVEEHIVAVFGHGEPVDTFIGKLTAAYPEARLISDDPIM